MIKFQASRQIQNQPKPCLKMSSDFSFMWKYFKIIVLPKKMQFYAENSKLVYFYVSSNQKTLIREKNGTE